MKQNDKLIHLTKLFLQNGGLADVDSIVAYLQATDPKLKRLPLASMRLPIKKFLEDNPPAPTAPAAPAAHTAHTAHTALFAPVAGPPLPQKRAEPEKASSTMSFASIGGISKIKRDLEQLIIFPLRHPEVYQELKVEPARGVLFCGSPGTGKTYLANALCEELDIPSFKIAAPEIVSGMSGESEQKLRDVFRKAAESAPSLLFIDEIDAITPKRSNSQREMEKRIVSQLLTCMDELGGFLQHGKLVIVIAATNRIEAIDPALRRAGRFDREIHFGIPSQEQRAEILKVMIQDLKIRGDIGVENLAKLTPGYVGADLHSLIKEAANQAIARIMDSFPFDLSSLYVEMGDFSKALEIVQPSSKREGFSTIPDTTWEDVGGLEELREELHFSIVHAISNPEKYLALGITSAAGVLLCGPPGCGKTLLAKAVANESRANFIAVNGPELLNKYVGESEKAVRQLFQRARDSAPCVIFFDEIDSLCAARGSDNQATERVVNQLLTELNGLQDRKQVFVIAATNRPDIIDPAILRPGRLDQVLFVLLPKTDQRTAILKALMKKVPNKDVDVLELAERTEGFSGADLAMVVREAANQVLRENEGETFITQRHFDKALDKIRPSVSPQQNQVYINMKKARGRG